MSESAKKMINLETASLVMSAWSVVGLFGLAYRLGSFITAIQLQVQTLDNNFDDMNEEMTIISNNVQDMQTLLAVLANDVKKNNE